MFIKQYDLIFLQIVKVVIKHETALRAQAKKMNVESLRSNTVSFFYLINLICPTIAALNNL